MISEKPCNFIISFLLPVLIQVTGLQFRPIFLLELSQTVRPDPVHGFEDSCSSTQFQG